MLPLLIGTLMGCAPEAQLPGSSLAAPGDFTLTLSNLVAGEPALFDVAGATPLGAVELAMSTSGLGSGPCPASFGGVCFDVAGPVRRPGFAANVRPSGTATGTFAVPMRAAGAYLAFQAVDGPGVLSNPVARLVGSFGTELTADGDLDLDGYTIADGDCADFDAAWSPEAVDLVGDGLDHDCDNLDGADDDGDGYFAVASGGDDCDDLDPEISPGAMEVCDQQDNDCVGGVDDGLDCDTVLTLDGASRRWADGTFATSCDAYRHPATGYAYDGATGDGLYRIDPSGADPFDVFCDMTRHGGGWTMVYSTRDDNTGDNSMGQGTRLTAHITSLDPGNANKKLAYDLVTTMPFNDLMFSGYQDYNNQTNRVTFWINDRGADLRTFFAWGIGRNVTNSDRCAQGFFGVEADTGLSVAMAWENFSVSVGTVASPSCAWMAEVWSEIDDDGGHVLAPASWGTAEVYNVQTPSKGAALNRGLYHMFIR
jgi:hypothetical protein